MNYDYVLKKIAREHKSTVEETVLELQRVIDDSVCSSVPEIRNYWDKIPRSGDVLTVDELIGFIAGEIEKEKNI